MQESLRTASASIIEQILACYGVGKDGMAVLAQLIVASRLQGEAGDRAHQMILQGLSGIETLDGKAIGGGVDAPTQTEQDAHSERALKLMCAFFADKAITYKMPHPELHIPGVPDEEQQESPREHIKRTVQSMLPDSGSKKIQ